MLSLDLTSSTWALEEEDDADDAAALDGLPMIPKPKRRRNAGGHAAPSTPSLVTDEDTAGRRRLWSICIGAMIYDLGDSECRRCRCMLVLLVAFRTIVILSYLPYRMVKSLSNGEEDVMVPAKIKPRLDQ